MSRLVHIQTQIQTVFGLLDDDGNVIPQQPVTRTISLFRSEEFANAYGSILAERDQALANFDAEQISASEDSG